jgi:Alw26I/Eco31I/Esp3I family type II restriction m6 adenine DNA methyltransferase
LKRYPTLSETPGVQVWRGELDLTLNKRCIIKAKNKHPLIRGSDISRFQLTEDSRGQFVDFEMLKEQLGKSKRIRHVGCARIATQQVSNMNQRWRLKCAPIPSSTVIANSCNYIVLNECGAECPSTWYLLGVLNSELLNWRFHASSFNNHISVRELRSLPIALPSKTEGLKLRDKIARQAQALSHNADRETTRLDAMVFCLYGLDSKTVSHILETRGTPSDAAEDILEMMKEHV